MMHPLLIILAGLLFPSPCLAAWASFQDSSTAIASGWYTLKFGGGGFSGGIQLFSNGAGTLKNNSGGGYVRSSASSQWQNVVTTTSLPSGVYNAQIGFFAATELVAAPTNTNTLFMKLNGYILSSTNFGASWTQTSFPQVASNTETPGGTASGILGPLIAVDPANASNVLAGSPGNTVSVSGLYYSSNGGSTWSLISSSSVPQSGTTGSTNGYFLLGYDSTTTSGGSTPGIWVCPNGHQCLHTTTGPSGTWTATTGGPTGVQQLLIDQFGIVWAVDLSNNVWEYNGSWSEVLTGGYASVAVDPNSASQVTSHVFAVQINGNMNVSLNGGSTWSGLSNGNGATVTAATDIPWLASIGYTDQNIGRVTFDPSGSAPYKLVATTGIDIVSTIPPTSSVTSTQITWTSLTAATETLVATYVVAPPNGNVNMFAWDREQGYSANSNSYIANLAYSISGIMAGAAADWASSSTSTMVMVAYDNNGGAGTGLYLDQSGYSTNGGQTWTLFGTTSASTVAIGTGSKTWLVSAGNYTVNDTVAVFETSNLNNWMNGVVTCYNNTGGTCPGELVLNVANFGSMSSGTHSDWTIHSIPPVVITGNVGGCIAASSASRFVWVPSNNVANPWYTLDGGVTWNPFTAPGVPTTGTTGWGASSGGGVADQFNCAADRVLTDTFYIFNNSSSARGIYTCTISGTISCGASATYSGSPSGAATDISHMKAVPGQSGNLFFADNLGNCVGGSPSTNHLMRSTNGGAAWSAVMDGSNYMNAVNAFGFGAIASGQSYPTIYVAGCDGGIYGLWFSKDNGSTWTNLGYPNGSYNIVTDVDGDKIIAGEVYVGFSGSGFSYYYQKLNFLLNRDLDPASNDNSPMWLEKAA